MENHIACLLIDDDADDQEVFEMCLKKVSTRISCKTAMNGIDGITLLSSGNFVPAFIFIDVNMPKMNGLECLKQLKQMDHLKHARFIMYSTTAEDNAVIKANSLGAEFLIKPAKPQDLTNELSLLFKSLL